MDNNKLENFGSFYFYLLSKIYKSGWGTKKNNLRYYCYFFDASTIRVKQLGTGTIIAYFRRYKAKLKLEEVRYKELDRVLAI